MEQPKTYLFVGGCTRRPPYYASANATGIAAFAFDETTGQATPIGVTEGIDNPTWLTADPLRGVLYANSEVFGWHEGLVSAFRIDRATGALAYLNKQVTLGSIAAQHSLDRSGRFLLLANYSLGPIDDSANSSVVVFPLRADGGLLPAIASASHTGTGPHPERQERSHAHSAQATPDNRFVIVADLGIDCLLSYHFNAETGAIAEAARTALPPGSGPRHFAFHPSGRFAYVVNELASTVAALAFDAETGSFQVLSITPTVPEPERASNACSEIRISPNGRFVYAANRGHDSLTRFRISDDGHLTQQQITPSGGRTPRHFAFDPTGRFVAVANQDSDLVSLFAWDPETGTLTPTPPPIPTGTPTGVCFCRL